MNHLANLRVHSIQRTESINTVLKKTLTYQIFLLKACKCLIKIVKEFEIKLLEGETMSIAIRSQILDLNSFMTVLKKVVTYAIDFIALEWAATCILKPDSI
jgi:hypothetical protein